MMDVLQHEVQVWLARPEPWSLGVLETRFLPLLSEEEQQRCQRFYFEHDRKHYLAAHALLRLCLAQHLECAPQQVRMAQGANGKPELAGDSGTAPLRFNLSHTRGMVACAVTRSHACGIDVERIRAMPEMDGMAETVFSESEIAYLVRHDAAARPLAFFTLWTLKEAYIKATGLGMSAPLRHISLAPDALLVRDGSRPAQHAGAWLFDSWLPAPGHALALACENDGTLGAIDYHELDLGTAQLKLLHRKSLARS